MMFTAKMTFSEELKKRFKDFITQRSGLYFKDHDLKGLEEAVALRMKACSLDSTPAYYDYLTASEKTEDEFRELLNILTINHTYFFRNEPHFKALKETVLSEIIQKKRKDQQMGTIDKPTIRIWSTGCSTGEEPYSIAMVLRDVIKDLDEWDIEIFATDASINALQKAREGIYGKNSMRLIDNEHRDKYFRQKVDSRHNVKYAISDVIKKMVNFSFFNLMDDVFPFGFDIILCRNIVIYFEFETTLKVMNKIYSSLNDNGYLFIGYSENLQFMPRQFKMHTSNDAIFYRKVIPKASPLVAAPEPAKEVVEQALEEISKAEVEAERVIEAEYNVASSGKIKSLLIKITKFLHLKEYDRALALIEEAHKIDKNAVEPYYLEAEIYANQGRFSRAKQRLSFILSLNTLFAPAHYLLGYIHAEEKDLEEAKKSLKRALYVDKDFSPAHLYLAHLYKIENRLSDAMREYKNTLKSLLRSAPHDIIAYSGGFNVAIFMSICHDNITRLRAEV